jgi:universal stress protein A
MFNHILIPTDLSAHAERAVDVAIDLAKLAGGTVTLVHVIQTIQGVEFEEMKSFYAELESRARKRLAGLVVRHTDTGVTVRMEVAYGAPAAEILRLCEDREVDLVVLASHAVNREEPASGWGTLSYKVGLLVTCPVLLVK